MLIDSSSLDLFSIHNKKEEFIQQLSHNYLCFYDNVRFEPKWLSDEACRAVTGGAFSKRMLYTDDEQIPYKYKKILAFTGINVIFTQEDALDRSIKIQLERIKDTDNIPDTKIDEETIRQIPGLLAYIFDVLAKALEIKDYIEFERLPRMADFAEWGEAIARAMGYKDLEFLNAYFENIGEQNIDIIEAEPFAEAISKFQDYETTSWISSPKTLIKILTGFADSNGIDSSKFPKNPTAVSRRLNRIRSNLREGLGIEVMIERITSDSGNSSLKNTTVIKIRRIPPLAPLAPLDENDEGNTIENSGGIQNGGDNTSTEPKIPPRENSQNHAQITSDIDNSGGSGGSGAILRKETGSPKDSISQLLPSSLIVLGSRQRTQKKIEARLFTNSLICNSDLLLEDYEYNHEIINNIDRFKGTDRWFCKNCTMKGDKWLMMKHTCKINKTK